MSDSSRATPVARPLPRAYSRRIAARIIFLLAAASLAIVFVDRGAAPSVVPVQVAGAIVPVAAATVPVTGGQAVRSTRVHTRPPAVKAVPTRRKPVAVRPATSGIGLVTRANSCPRFGSVPGVRHCGHVPGGVTRARSIAPRPK
jgi:hypothetical protein